MGDQMQYALMLMIIGMITVFLILFLLVIFSKLLIRFVNRYLPEAHPKTVIAGDIKPGISGKYLAIILGVTEVITKGKGRIKKIQKIK